MKEKIHLILLIIVVILAIPMFMRALDREKKYFAYKADAVYLSELSCKETCIVNANIQKVDVKEITRKDRVYTFRYQFKYLDKIYHKEFHIFEQNSVSPPYIPEVYYSRNKALTEAIKFDPYDPDVNLPVGYISGLLKASNPFLMTKLFGLFFLMVLATITYILVKGKKGQSES